MDQVHGQLVQRDARIKQLTSLIDRYRQAWVQAKHNHGEVINAFMERWRGERKAQYQELFKLEERARDLESAFFAGRWVMAIPAPDSSVQETKAEPGQRVERHPFFTVSSETVPGTLLHRELYEGCSIMRAPDQILLDPDGGVAYIDPERFGWGWVHPDPKRSFHFEIPAYYGRLFGFCKTRSTTYVCYLHHDGTRRMQPLEGKKSLMTPFGIPETLKEDPVALIGMGDEIAYLAPNAIFLVIPKPNGEEATGFLHFRAQGKPLKAGSQFVLAGKTSVPHFIEPGTPIFGRVATSAIPKGKNDSFAVDRWSLPDRGTATAIAVAPWNREYLFVTDAAKDRLYRIQTGDLEAVTIQLQPGTRPGAITQGPENTLVFATATGFGCVTAAGAVQEIPLLRGQKVSAKTLAYDSRYGKIYFLDPNRPGIGALDLCVARPGAHSGAAPDLDAAWIFRGPSLIAALGPSEASPKPAAPAREPETQAEAAKSSFLPGPRIGRGSPAPPNPEAGGLGLEAGLAPDPEPGAEEDESSDSEEGDDELVEEDQALEAVADPDPVGAFLRGRRIPWKQYRHVLDEHASSEAPKVDSDGFIKSQFSADITRGRLGTFRNFKKFVRALLTHGTNPAHRFEGDSSLVLELDWTEGVGRVWSFGANGWMDTNRVRLALALGDDDHFFLTSFYPIPRRAAVASPDAY